MRLTVRDMPSGVQVLLTSDPNTTISAELRFAGGHSRPNSEIPLLKVRPSFGVQLRTPKVGLGETKTVSFEGLEEVVDLGREV